MQIATYRKYQQFMLLLSILVLAFSYYIEVANQLKPCPLCFMQRGCTFLLVFLGVLGVFTSSLRKGNLLSWLQFTIAGLGLYFSSRQLWLQSLPMPESGQCMPGLQAMLHYFSWDMILKSFFWGNSDCSHVDWRWLGMSIPLWSALYFLSMLILNVCAYVPVFYALRQREQV